MSKQTLISYRVGIVKIPIILSATKQNGILENVKKQQYKVILNMFGRVLSPEKYHYL